MYNTEEKYIKELRWFYTLNGEVQLQQLVVTKAISTSGVIGLPSFTQKWEKIPQVFETENND